MRRDHLTPGEVGHSKTRFASINDIVCVALLFRNSTVRRLETNTILMNVYFRENMRLRLRNRRKSLTFFNVNLSRSGPSPDWGRTDSYMKATLFLYKLNAVYLYVCLDTETHLFNGFYLVQWFCLCLF